jgi:hypothetical protein
MSHRVLARLRSPIPAGIEAGVFQPLGAAGASSNQDRVGLPKFSHTLILIVGIRSADGFRPRYREGLAGPEAVKAFPTSTHRHQLHGPGVSAAVAAKPENGPCGRYVTRGLCTVIDISFHSRGTLYPSPARVT